ncbi:MAG: ImmA/IrrE family metallo-endopeptidase [Chloroflexi bacterium]|nr:ImmA/IrrE family metallo-endopeptidase [Chloroflexota bacterium]
MRWVLDHTGRFPRRPHYTTDELEQACEDLLRELRTVRPTPAPAAPLSTDDLIVLIERRAGDLDLYADLTTEGADVEALTDFVPGQRPRVRVRSQLSDHPRHAHRLRTTLAHELAHVVLHDFIWWFDQGRLDAERALALSPRCQRARAGGSTDWMEWQANYAAGALLMPDGALRRLLDAGDARYVRSSGGRQRLRQVQGVFDVSAEAARVRLLQLGYLSQRPSAVLAAPVPAGLKRGG